MMSGSGRRSPMHGSRPASKQPVQLQQKKIPPSLVTYRLDDEMVYVEPAKDHEQALDFAQSVFPRLAFVSRSRIVFLVNVKVNGALRLVRISPMAWSRAVQSLATYEIVEVTVLPEQFMARAARSDTNLATSSSQDRTTGDSYDSPPKYGMLGDDLTHSFDGMNIRDSEKSPCYTFQSPETLHVPPCPSVKRCTSSFGWFTKRF